MNRTSYRVQFPGGSGFELAGIVDEPPLSNDGSREPDASAPVVVFSHCFTCNKDLKAIVRISRALAVRGVRVLRYDMTGLGSSDGDFSRTNFTTNLEDLRAAIRFAGESLGPVTALLGHSFGGAAALALAGSISLGKEPAFTSSIRCVVTLAAPSDTTHLATLLSLMNSAIQSEGVGDVVIGGVRWTVRREMLADFRSHDLPDLIAQIRLPLLLFQSPQDTTVGFDHALRIMSLVQSASGGRGAASLAVLPGADHLLSSAAADIDYVADASAAFIRRYASPKTSIERLP